MINNKKVRNIKRSRARGVEYEQKIARELRDLGYKGVSTSRAESKTLDNAKIDIVDKDNILPCYIQLKRTLKYPNYFDIESQCAFKDKPFVIIWNCQKPTEKTFRSIGELAIIPKSFFYELIKLWKLVK